MKTKNIVIVENYYTDRIIEIIEDTDTTQSDKVGQLNALVQTIARDESLLTFEERLDRAREQDLF